MYHLQSIASNFFFPFQAQENEEDDVGTLDSAVCSGSLAESIPVNIEVCFPKSKMLPCDLLLTLSC